MKRLTGIVLLLMALCLFACQRPTDKPGSSIKEEVLCGCDTIPPPPPPPAPFKLIKTSQLVLEYDGKPTTFRASISTNQLFDLSNSQLQTYTVTASNTYRPGDKDFYFALPPDLNRYWNAVTLRKTTTGFVIGYRNDSTFAPLYTLSLGNEINRGSIYMVPWSWHPARRSAQR